MKRALLLLPILLLSACGGTPDVAPVNETPPTDAAMEAQPSDAGTQAADDGAQPAEAMAAADTMTPTVVDEPAPADALPINYDESSITFVGRSSIIDHEGHFGKFRAILQQQDGDWLKTMFRFDVDLRTVATDSEMLNGHLQKDDFFDTANYPVATFISDGGVWPRDDGGFEVDGALTVKGTTKTVTVTFYKEEQTLRMHLDFPRKDFGVGNDSYGDKILDEVMPVDGVIVLQ